MVDVATRVGKRAAVRLERSRTTLISIFGMSD